MNACRVHLFISGCHKFSCMKQWYCSGYLLSPQQRQPISTGSGQPCEASFHPCTQHWHMAERCQDSSVPSWLMLLFAISSAAHRRSVQVTEDMFNAYPFKGAGPDSVCPLGFEHNCT